MGWARAATFKYVPSQFRELHGQFFSRFPNDHHFFSVLSSLAATLTLYFFLSLSPSFRCFLSLVVCVRDTVNQSATFFQRQRDRQPTNHPPIRPVAVADNGRPEQYTAETRRDCDGVFVSAESLFSRANLPPPCSRNRLYTTSPGRGETIARRQLGPGRRIERQPRRRREAQCAGQHQRGKEEVER